MNISATILAAGKSSRMGNTNKLLMTIDGKPIVKLVCESVLATSFDPIMVVTGFEKHKIETALIDLKMQFIYNGLWADGMATSIFSGIAALPEDIDGNLIVLGDMPFVSAETLEKLKSSFIFHEGRYIIYPQYGERQANPVLFPKRYFGEILSYTGDRGCKKVLKQHHRDAISVPIDSNEVILDCDTNEDYLQMKLYSEDLDVKP